MSSSPVSSLATLFAPASVCPAFAPAPAAAAASVYQTLINLVLPLFILGCLVLTATTLKAATASAKASSKATLSVKPSSGVAVTEKQAAYQQEEEESIHPAAIPIPIDIQSDSLSSPKSSFLILVPESTAVPSHLPAQPESRPFDNDQPAAISPKTHPLVPIEKPFEYFLRWDLPDGELAELKYSAKARRYAILTNPPPKPKVDEEPVRNDLWEPVTTDASHEVSIMNEAPQSVVLKPVEPAIDPYDKKLELPKRNNALLRPEIECKPLKLDNLLYERGYSTIKHDSLALIQASKLTEPSEYPAGAEQAIKPPEPALRLSNSRAKPAEPPEQEWISPYDPRLRMQSDAHKSPDEQKYSMAEYRSEFINTSHYDLNLFLTTPEQASFGDGDIALRRIIDMKPPDEVKIRGGPNSLLMFKMMNSSL